MSEIFRNTKHRGNSSEDELKSVIKVIPSSFWIILIGGIVILIGMAIWTFTGWYTTTVTLTGVYHPTTSGYGEVICFPSLAQGKVLTTEMDCTVVAAGYNTTDYGYLQGQIAYVDPYITTAEEMVTLVEDKSLANAFYANAPVMCVICKLEEDSETVSGFRWSKEKGEGIEIADGTIMTVSVVTSKEQPSIFGN